MHARSRNESHSEHAHEAVGHRRHFRRLAGITLALLLAGARPGACEWQRYVAADGLADNWVNTVFEDHAGNLWFGTANGLSRYDGTTWKTFTMADGLPGNFVSSIAEDRAGNLWFAIDAAVSRYDGATWKSFTTADGLPDAAGMNSIIVDHAGNVWVGTNGAGVTRYDGTHWTTFAEAGFDVRAVFEDRSGNIWAGGIYAAVGLTRFDGTSWVPMQDAWVVSIAQDHDGNLWFGTSAGWGVLRYDGTIWKSFTTADGLADNHVNSIEVDRSGNLWFGTSGAASLYDGSTWTTFTDVAGVSGIRQDHLGNLWFGTISGVGRYDGVNWRSFTTADGLPSSSVLSCTEDASGNLWLGTSHGVARYDGVTWTNFAAAAGAPRGIIRAIHVDHNGVLWAASGGVSRYDGSTWRTFTTDDGLPDNIVFSIAEDRAGNLWFGGLRGVTRYDGASWRAFTSDSLPIFNVFAMARDSSGDLFLGCGGRGVVRYDGQTWQPIVGDSVLGGPTRAMIVDHADHLWVGGDAGLNTYDGIGWKRFTTRDGLAANQVHALCEDRFGNIWIGCEAGVSRFDGTLFGSYSTADGLVGQSVLAVLAEHSGRLWFGATRLDPDQVPPRTVTLTRPPRVSAARSVSAAFVAAYGESRGIAYSLRFDGGPWSDWMPTGAWHQDDLADGMHLLEGRTRDRIGNVDPHPDSIAFEIDATPPTPVITSPASGEVVRGILEIAGTAADARFGSYECDFRALASPSWTVLAQSSTPVDAGRLGTWDTRSLPDGGYELRLVVRDTLGLAGTALTSVAVQRNPSDTVRVDEGGDVYTADRALHAYFPPHAFAHDARVTITPLPASLVPEELPDGARLIATGDSLDFGGVELVKPAVLDVSYPEGIRSSEAPAIYHARGGDWVRIGGTYDRSRKILSSQLTQAGRYALYTPPVAATGRSGLTALTLTPRVFSPRVGTPARDVAIGFTLGRAAIVAVRVYSRSGRLVRVIDEGVPMGAGSNVVRWDGQDRDGRLAADGLYIVGVEALGETKSLPVAVVR